MLSTTPRQLTLGIRLRRPRQPDCSRLRSERLIRLPSQRERNVRLRFGISQRDMLWESILLAAQGWLRYLRRYIAVIHKLTPVRSADLTTNPSPAISSRYRTTATPHQRNPPA